jgi:serine beta-lactamase-like protein LACTB
VTDGSLRAWAAAALLAGAAHVPLAPGAAAPSRLSTDSLPVTTAVRSPEREATIDSALGLLKPVARAGAGLAVGVSVEGRPVWAAGIGFADLRSGVPVDPDTTRFRVYSVSKGITTLAAAALVEAGKLDLSAPVRGYVPDFPDKGQPITASELLAHTAGIRHYRDATEASSRRHCSTVADALPIFEDDPLLHPPGETRSYSSWGYVLLSRVLEAAAGESFPDLVRRRILQPSGAVRTAVDDPTREISGRATFYSVPKSGRTRPAPVVDNTCKWGAGAYLSTASDLLAIYRALLRGELLGPATLQAMVFRGAEPDPAGRRVLEISGWGEGAAAFTAADLDSGVVVVLLSNAIGPEYGPRVQRAFGRLRALFDPAP